MFKSYLQRIFWNVQVNKYCTLLLQLHSMYDSEHAQASVW